MAWLLGGPWSPAWGEAQPCPCWQVGWIFTDLVSEDTRKGTVRYSRNKVRAGRLSLTTAGSTLVWVK